MLAPWRKIYDKGRQCIKKQRDYFANKCPYTQNYYFSKSHVWMCELDHEEGWTPKTWFFWTVVLEKTPENHLDFKEIQSVDPKRKSVLNIHWRTEAEAEVPILWSPDVKSWLIGKDLYAGKDWRQEEKGTTEVEMVGWHHQLYGHEFE